MDMTKIRELEAKLREMPLDDATWFALGKEYFDTDFRKAHSCFSMALAQRPFNADYRLNRGRKSLSLDSFEEALADLSLAVRLDIEDGEKWHYLGNAYFFLGRYQEAIDCYKSAMERHRRNVVGLEAPAIDWIWMAYMQDGRPEEAMAYVKANASPDMHVEESDLSYKKRILLYAGYTDIDTYLREVRQLRGRAGRHHGALRRRQLLSVHRAGPRKGGGVPEQGAFLRAVPPRLCLQTGAQASGRF